MLGTLIIFSGEGLCINLVATGGNKGKRSACFMYFLMGTNKLETCFSSMMLQQFCDKIHITPLPVEEKREESPSKDYLKLMSGHSNNKMKVVCPY